MPLDIATSQTDGGKIPILPKLLPINDAARLLGVGRTTLYELIGNGELESVHLGHRHLVVYESAEQLVERLRGGER